MGFEAYGNCYSALSVALSIKLSSIKRRHIACQAEGNVAEALLIWLCVDKVSDFMHLYLMLNSMSKDKYFLGRGGKTSSLWVFLWFRSFETLIRENRNFPGFRSVRSYLVVSFPAFSFWPLHLFSLPLSCSPFFLN